ncbi:MAG: DUF1934 domain-containing protein, partial [Hungatella sp.]
MTRDVLISISGEQMTDGETGDIEMITTGDYFEKNGKHYIIYDEITDGIEGVTRNTIKVLPERMDIIKRGYGQTQMLFEKNKKHLTCYATPVGDLMIGINTNQILVEEQEDLLRIDVKYSLDINYEHVSE